MRYPSPPISSISLLLFYPRRLFLRHFFFMSFFTFSLHIWPAWEVSLEKKFKKIFLISKFFISRIIFSSRWPWNKEGKKLPLSEATVSFSATLPILSIVFAIVFKQRKTVTKNLFVRSDFFLISQNHSETISKFLNRYSEVFSILS